MAAAKISKFGPKNTSGSLPAEPIETLDDDQDLAQYIADEIADRLQRARFTEYTLHLAIKRALQAVDPRLLGRQAGTLVLMRLPSERWRDAAEHGFARALEAILGSEQSLARGFITLPEISTEKWKRSDPEDRVEGVLARLMTASVLLVAFGRDTVHPALEAMVDLVVDLSAIPLDCLGQAWRRRFGEEAGGWPLTVDPLRLSPMLIDALVARAATSGAAAASLAVPTLVAQDVSQGPRLEDLHGYGAAKEWGLRLVQSLEDFRAGRISAADIDGGALLAGPPGTGKTLLASSLARSADVPFFPTSYAAWQSAGEGHLGNVLKEMRRIFSAASAVAPALIFIDEIDTLQARGSTGRYDDWWRSIINALLECMDGTDRRAGVIVLAACNEDRNLDAALVRSGRLDRRFYVGLPSSDDLGRILRHHLPELADDDVQPVATFLAGTASGADAARIARDARHAARAASRDVSAADLMAAAVPPDTRPEAVRRRIAVHEAGHATAVLRQGRVPNSLSIACAGGGRVVHEREQTELVLSELRAQLAVHLAGRAAEEIVLGAVSAGAGGVDASDLGQATKLVALLEGRLGLGARISVAETVDQELVERRLRVAYVSQIPFMTPVHNPLCC
ncbi:AAA family ATPase [Jiella sp. M17.18]|uniref:AAA family ATPase n=1 Tax=Jiella sp. M17.18 TaxID=3234247 RepID=UPI0034DE30A6